LDDIPIAICLVQYSPFSNFLKMQMTGGRSFQKGGCNPKQQRFISNSSESQRRLAERKGGGRKLQSGER